MIKLGEKGKMKITMTITVILANLEGIVKQHIFFTVICPNSLYPFCCCFYTDFSEGG